MSEHRLPRSVAPRHYDIEIAPDLDAATFTGTVAIDLDIVETVDTIVLNAADLAIDDARVEVGAETLDATVSLDEELERCTIALPGEVGPGAARLHLTFTGVLNDQLRGFYRSTFTDESGTVRTIATTQFESTNARRAFPCFDEPDRKATFGVTLVVADDLLAISSGAEVERTPLGDGRVAVRFAPTMLLSTYLLAFVVGPLDATDSVDVDGVPLRIVHPIGKGHLTPFALEVGAFSLRHFSDYFAIPYPGDKLDLVALPDFAFGAMENMGCATFREVLLLLDPAASTQPEQQRAADVIAHEIAHMWFGDLVTMEWWNGIWLKEAFATFCEMHCTDAWRPEWQRWVDFGLSRTDAFDVDGLLSTRPIEFEVVSPADAEAMYDVLTYEKGAAVVRMLEQYLGPDRFRDGIRHYLATHAYGNTDTTDLWDAIEEVTGDPVRAIMDTWIFQGGHPVVSIERSGPDRLTVHQSRFLSRRDAVLDEPLQVVPLVVATGDESGRSDHRLLLDGPDGELTVGSFDWALPNSGATGFYRSRLVGSLLDDALVALERIDPIERYGIVDDAWAGVLAGITSIDELRRVIDAVAATETDVSVWRRVAGVLTTLDHHVADDARDAHRAWAVGLVGAALDRIGRQRRDDEPDRVHDLRGVLVGAAGVLGDPGTIALARELHASSDDPTLGAAAIRVLAANGGPDEFAEFAGRFESATTPQEERRFLFALPGFPGASELETLLAMVDERRIRSQDAPFVLGAAIANRDQGGAAWAYVRDRWDELNERFPTTTIPRMIAGIEAVGDPALAAEIEAFFAEHPVPQAGKSLDQHLERMAITVDLRSRLRSTER